MLDEIAVVPLEEMDNVMIEEGESSIHATTCQRLLELLFLFARIPRGLVYNIIDILFPGCFPNKGVILLFTPTYKLKGPGYSHWYRVGQKQGIFDSIFCEDKHVIKKQQKTKLGQTNKSKAILRDVNFASGIKNINWYIVRLYYSCFLSFSLLNCMTV